MKIDLAVVAVVLFFGGMGLWSGAIRQLAHLGGLVVGWVAARPLAQLAGPSVAKLAGYPVVLTTVGLSFAAFFLIYVVVVLLLRSLLTHLLPDGEHGWANRAGGFVLGATKAALLAFVVLSALAFLEKPLGGKLRSAWPSYRRESARSISMRVARRHGLFASLPVLNGLERVLRAGKDPNAAAQLAADPELQALSQDPKIRTLVDDAVVRRALQRGDLAELLSSARVLDALDDPKLVERLTRFASQGPPPVVPAVGRGITPRAAPRD